MVVRTHLQLPRVDMTGAAVITAASAIAVVVALQELPLPEKWTIVSILGFVLAAAVWLLRSIGGRLVDSIDRSADRSAASIDANTKSLAELVMELRTLTQQNAAFQEATSKKHEEYATEREKAVADLKETIRDAMERARGRAR